MVSRLFKPVRVIALSACSALSSADEVQAADRLIGLHSAQVMSQSMPWIAQEAVSLKNMNWISGWFLFLRRRLPPRLRRQA